MPWRVFWFCQLAIASVFLACAALVAAFPEAIDEDHAAFVALEQAIMDEEGFRSRPYRDSARTSRP